MSLSLDCPIHHINNAERPHADVRSPAPVPASLVGVVAYQQLKTRAKKRCTSVDAEMQLSFARGFCALALNAYWEACDRKSGGTIWPIKSAPIVQPLMPMEDRALAQTLGVLIATFPMEDAGYLMGSLYTVMLPESMRSDLGAYYTPPPLVSRLIDNAVKVGTDLSTCSVIDPACGGGAFLAPVAARMMALSRIQDPLLALEDIISRLHGIEIDPFAGWMTEVLLEATLLPLCKQAGTRVSGMVTIGDALEYYDAGRFDLVIGNPPYGRIKLDAAQRERYARSLFGHANLYGLFTDLALRLAKDDGVIAYLTPTSFLGGQYFKSLRALLTAHALPVSFDFVSDRNGVFDDVLQETILVVYRSNTAVRSDVSAVVSSIVPQGLEDAQIEPVGSIRVPKTGAPWMIPRSLEDAAYVSRLLEMPTRLSHFGFEVSTGQLVWNRHKPQFRYARGAGTYPVIWAESVSAAGFIFSAARRNHAPFIALSGSDHLLTRKSCVLLQRTTAKEQGRRLISAVIPQWFIDEYDGVVVENHLNIIYAADKARVLPETISLLLNSAPVDRAFRCISGSVAVSAYELEALPLPSVDQVRALERLMKSGAADAALEQLIASFYEN